MRLKCEIVKLYCSIILISIPLISPSLIRANDIISKYNKAQELYKVEKYNNAITEYKELIVRLKHEKTDFEPTIDVVNYKLGLSFLKIGDYKSAIFYLKKALQTRNSTLLCKTYISLGLIHTYVLDYNKSVKYLNNALKLHQKEKLDDKQLEWIIFNYLGLTFSEMGEFKLAIKYYKKSLEIKHIINDQGKTYLNIANKYFELGNFSSAEKYYILALKEYSQDSAQNRINIEWVNMNYGWVFTKKGNITKGLAILKKALNTFSTEYGTKHSLTAYTNYLIGKSFFNNDDNKSLKYYQNALIAKVRPFNDTIVSANPSLKDIIPDNDILKFLKAKSNALIKLSETENRQKNLEVALNTLELTTQLIENLHKGFQYEKSRLELLENERKTFSDIIMVSLRLYNVENMGRLAFQSSNLSKRYIFY